MKSEKDFLSSMWSEISAHEFEEKQKHRAYEVNRRLFIKEALAYVIVLVLFAAGGLTAFYIKNDSEIIYAAAFLLFTAAFLAERLFYSKSQGGIC